MARLVLSRCVVLLRLRIIDSHPARRNVRPLNRLLRAVRASRTGSLRVLRWLGVVRPARLRLAVGEWLAGLAR